MSVLGPTRLALSAAIAVQVPSVQVLAVPPAENLHRKEAIWIDSASCEFEWRSIGAGPSFASRNRTENLTFDIKVHVYREGPDQTDASEAAINRAEVLLAAIEDALESNGGTTGNEFTIGGNVTSALITRWTVLPKPVESGWAVVGTATVEATNVV